MGIDYFIARQIRWVILIALLIVVSTCLLLLLLDIFSWLRAPGKRTCGRSSHRRENYVIGSDPARQLDTRIEFSKFDLASRNK
jgi:hypothetical protein